MSHDDKILPIELIQKNTWLAKTKIEELVKEMFRYVENRIPVPDELSKECKILITSRIKAIKEVIDRCTEADLPVQPEWVEEYNELISFYINKNPL